MRKVRTLRRREATERVDLTFLNAVSTTRLWDGHQERERRASCTAWCEFTCGDGRGGSNWKTRRLYIDKVDMVKHGLTEECLGCRSFADGK